MNPMTALPVEAGPLIIPERPYHRRYQWRNRATISSTSADTLYCVGTVMRDGGKVAARRWTYKQSATVGPPVIADVAGRGEASILLVGVDGWVYCIQ